MQEVVVSLAAALALGGMSVWMFLRPAQFGGRQPGWPPATAWLGRLVREIARQGSDPNYIRAVASITGFMALVCLIIAVRNVAQWWKG